MPRDDRRRSRSRSRSNRRRRTSSRDAKRGRRENPSSRPEDNRHRDAPTRRDEREPSLRKAPPPQQKKSAKSKFEDFDIGSILAPEPAPPPPPPPPIPLPTGTPFNIPGLGIRIGADLQPEGADNPLAEQPAREAASDPSVAAFVPMLPKSMLQLVLPTSAPNPQSLQLTVPVAPLVSAEFVKLARECRRCHVTGFPHTTTKHDLEAYFTAVCQEVRRKMVQRQTGKEVRENVIVDIDRVLDVFLDVTKNHPFAFVEVNFEDMSAELVAQSEDDMFNFLAADGRSYPLRIRRPKDFKNLTAVDPTKMVMLGVPPISESSIRDKVLAQYGTVKNFQMAENIVYCEFDDREPVDLCVEELNGFVLANRLIVVRALSDCLKAICFTAGIKMSPPAQAAAQEAAPPAVVERDLCKETMELITPLHKVLGGLSAIFPHLKPLFGSAVPVFPTRILVLLNAVDEQELVLDEDYSALLAAISDELEQYGRIKRLIVPRRTPMPPPPKPFVPKKIEPPRREVDLLSFKNPFDSDGAAVQVACDSAVESEEDQEYRNQVAEQEALAAKYEEEKEAYRRQREEWDAEIRHPIFGGYGRVFAEYESVDEAAFAQRSICGKLFSGRTVITSFMFEDVLYPPVEDERASNGDHEVTEAAEVGVTDVTAEGAHPQQVSDEPEGAADID